MMVPLLYQWDWGDSRQWQRNFRARAITVSKHLDAHIHLSSISSGDQLNLFGKQRKRNSHYRRHHTRTPNFTDERITPHKFQDPPLEEEEDRKALLDGLIEGTIDCICSAHEPHQEHLNIGV